MASNQDKTTATTRKAATTKIAAKKGAGKAAKKAVAATTPRSRSAKPGNAAKNDSAPANGAPTVPNPRYTLTIRHANVHNLKNISLELPRNRLIVITGVSGSGKSSLAFNTIYAEGQRRYVESLSSYARQFLARMAKPDVESITGLAPAVAIEQKTVTKNPRSTVGTTTEVYDYIRLLYGRIGKTICKKCGQQVHKDSPRTVQESLSILENGTKLFILFPMHAHTDRSVEEEFENLRQKGFFRVVIGESDTIVDLNDAFPEDVDKDDVYVLADRIVYSSKPEGLTRLADAIETSFREGDGKAIVHQLDTGKRHHYSTRFECANCQIRYEEPQPKLFSFNNPYGACPECQGFGRAIGVDMDLVIPDNSLTLRQGAIAAFATPKHLENQRAMEAIARDAVLDMDKPVSKLSSDEWEIVMNGYKKFRGINGFFKMVEENTYKMHYRVFLSRYRGYTTCPRCKGSRLRTSATQAFVHGKNIHAIVLMTIAEAYDWFTTLQLTEFEQGIARRVMEEITKRLYYLNEVGLGYLKLDRLSHTLSGGESQRINLATSIGSALVGAMYVLDEPSIGLHPRDTDRLISILKSLRDLGNTVIVVEHDPDIMANADVIVDMGPKAGEHGGEIIFNGTIDEIKKDKNSLTGQYISGKKSIPVPATRRDLTRSAIALKGVREHNLKDVDITFPLHTLTVVTGVSGSGKSTLVHDVLYPAVAHLRGEGLKSSKNYDSAEIRGELEAVEMVDQTPIGRSPRSNPSTYIKAFDAIRDLYAATSFARMNGWKPGHFSFNVPGGRCEACQGEGVVRVEMQFLADIELVCESCKGTRYKHEILQALFKGKSIVDVLEMTVDEGLEFFKGEKRIAGKLKALHDVGLGYIKLGQPATTLSGGEAQRVKLASHLSTPANKHTLFILDEPTTGLHYADIATLLKAFDALVKGGHSLIVIEHNLDVIKSADWIIDLGPEGGDAGGYIVGEGRPEELVTYKDSYTGKYLKKLL